MYSPAAPTDRLQPGQSDHESTCNSEPEYFAHLINAAVTQKHGRHLALRLDSLLRTLLEPTSDDSITLVERTTLGQRQSPTIKSIYTPPHIADNLNMPLTNLVHLEDALSVVAAEWNRSPQELRALLNSEQSDGHTSALQQFAAETLAFNSPAWNDHGSPDASSEFTMPDRYEDLGLIGQGAMGEVRRVRDRHLSRRLAMKIIHSRIMTRPTLTERFLSEARSTAHLQHPGIVPVHDMGVLPDGRLWFTMKEVKGKEVEEVIQDIHAVSPTQWQTTPTGWTLRRLIEAFRRICETMAFAHTHGVIHRDLKPSNLMVGEHGEVMVLDWGIAKHLKRASLSGTTTSLLPEEQQCNPTAHQPTQMGTIAGTPAYMAPEQARGEIDKIDARTDVYALGAVLYQVLSGRPPYTEHPTHSVLKQVLEAPPPALSAPARGTGSNLQGPAPPDALVEACEWSMRRDPAHRPQSATELAQAINDWLDGAQRRARAQQVIAGASKRRAEALLLQTVALQHRRQAEETLQKVQSWQPEADRHVGWDHQELAASVEGEAALLQVESERLLQASLTHAPDLAEAHAALADTYRAQHEEAEARGTDTHRAGAFLKQHLMALPSTDVRRADHLRYLTGNGSLTLLTDLPGAQVMLHRHKNVRNRRVLRAGRLLGETPLRGVSLPMGSYVCVLKHPHRDPVRYPVFIERGQHWGGIAPEDDAPTPIHLPAGLSEDEVYIPAGWFWAGARDGLASRYPPQRLWCDGMMMMRDPVSNADYCAYLNHLLDDGQLEAAKCAIPDVSPAASSPWVLRQGRFALQAQHSNRAYTPDHPVHFISWFQATTYAHWRAEHTDLPWRLPQELEWEKAARGVDRRQYPWGDTFCPAWSHVAGSVQDASGPSIMGAFPADISPYGVRGMAGNVMDWCADIFQADHRPDPRRRVQVSPPTRAAIDCEDHRVLRGGTWCYNSEYARLTARGRGRPHFKATFNGFRLVRSLEDSPVTA